VETIQIVVDEDLLREVDEAARRAGVTRSVLVREAIRQCLGRPSIQKLEREDREGYERQAQDAEEVAFWERAAASP
jgi:metal-responsive CopG/Arc/MetJ family transcriptional regulator